MAHFVIRPEVPLWTIVTVWDGPARRIVHAYDVYTHRPDAFAEARKMRKENHNKNVDIKVIKILQYGKDYG